MDKNGGVYKGNAHNSHSVHFFGENGPNSPGHLELSHLEFEIVYYLWYLTLHDL
jgi:hypothetical protein